MKIRSEDHKRVTLVPLNLTMEEKLSMTLFSITDFKLTDATDQSKGIQMKLKLKRKIMSEMMTTYFPSLLLMMITFATTFFKPFFFEAALSVNLTTMLVMTTIFISKMEGLPPTSATKMIDYWLILCQLVPFAQVVLLTAMEYLREGEVESKDSGTQYETDNEETNRPGTKEAWDIPQKKTRFMVPMLLVIGKLHFPQTTEDPPFSPETKLLPLAVLVIFIVYFGVAANFYFE